MHLYLCRVILISKDITLNFTLYNLFCCLPNLMCWDSTLFTLGSLSLTHWELRDQSLSTFIHSTVTSIPDTQTTKHVRVIYMYNVSMNSGINICQIMTIADNIDIYFQQHWIAILGDVGMDAASGIVPPYQQ